MEFGSLSQLYEAVIEHVLDLSETVYQVSALAYRGCQSERVKRRPFVPAAHEKLGPKMWCDSPLSTQADRRLPFEMEIPHHSSAVTRFWVVRKVSV